MQKNPTVYIVDDDAFTRDDVSQIAAELKYRNECFARAEEYLASASNSRPGCLVLDYVLRGMDGLQLQRKLLETTFPLPISLPIIVITACPRITVAVEFMRNGALTLLEKPYQYSQVRELIALAVENDRQQLPLGRRILELQECEQSLSPREHQILDLLIAGKLNKGIAHELDVSMRTVEVERARILEKFKAETAIELAAKYGELRAWTGQQQKIRGQIAEIRSEKKTHASDII